MELGGSGEVKTDDKGERERERNGKVCTIYTLLYILIFILGNVCSRFHVFCMPNYIYTGSLFISDDGERRPPLAAVIRVIQGKEPRHFCALFGGKMIVRLGGKASGFKNIGATDNFDTDGTMLFHVKGSDPTDMRVVQVAEQTSSLNSGDCFILLSLSSLTLWEGQHSNGAERERAREAAKAVREAEGAEGEVEVLEEGQEPDSFWKALGGKTEYASEKDVASLCAFSLVPPSFSSRLFQCTNRLGKIEVRCCERGLGPFVFPIFLSLYLFLRSTLH